MAATTVWIDPTSDTGRKEGTSSRRAAGTISFLVYTDVWCAPDIGLEPLASETGYVIANRVQVDYSKDPPSRTVVGAMCLPPPPPPGNDITGDETATQTGPAPQTDKIAEQITVDAIPASPEGTADIPGITGLETWFWYDGPTTRDISATVAGYTTTATVTPVAYRWQPCFAYTPPDRLPDDTDPVGCTPTTTLTSNRPGTRPPDDSNGASAATRFTYQTSGLYTLRLEIDWEGTWAFTAPDGTTLTTGTLATVTTQTTRPYLVEQIRTILLPDDA